MTTLQDYMTPRHPIHRPNSPNISLETLEALKKAEELVEETRQKIVQTKYISSLDLPTDQFSSAVELNDSDLYIRDLVTAKFFEANGLETTRTNLNSTLASKLPNSAVKTLPSRNVRVSRKDFEQQLEQKSSTPPKTRTRESLKQQKSRELSVQSVEKLDLYPISSKEVPRENVKTIDLVVTPQREIDLTLADAAVQTSQNELPRAEKPEETTNVTTENDEDLAPRSFLQFLCHMAQLEDIRKEPTAAENSSFTSCNESLESLDSFDLNPPNVEALSERLRRFDEEISRTSREIEKLNVKPSCESIVSAPARFRPQTCQKSVDLRAAEVKKRATKPRVKFIFKSRAPMSSSESTSTESLRPTRFSTPLSSQTNVARPDEKFSRSPSDLEGTFIAVRDSDVADNAPIVSDTTNSSSPVKCSAARGQKIDSVHSNCVDSGQEGFNDESATADTTTLPSYSNEEVQRAVAGQREIETHVNSPDTLAVLVVDPEDSVKLDKSKITSEKQSATSGSDNCRKIQLQAEDSSDSADKNPTSLSSVHDRTSFDVSGIYSESFEESDRSDGVKSEVRVDNFQQIVCSQEKLVESTARITLKDEKCLENYSQGRGSSSSVLAASKAEEISALVGETRSNGASTSERTADFSEGEIYLASSCSYSLGEIRIGDNNFAAILNKERCLSWASHVSTSTSPSLGEVLGSSSGRLRLNST